MLIGEAWGAEEERQGKPFVGASGWLLRSMLDEVGIRYDDCYVTNVFNLRPQPKNDIKNLCGPKSSGVIGFPALMQGKYIRSEFQSELDRLETEILSIRPTLIIALGATPNWFLTKTTGIRKSRGATTMSRFGIKVLPTYHPAAVLREWKLRPIVVADLHKAVREARTPEIIRPRREVWVEPTIEDILRFRRDYIEPAIQCCCDIETYADQITCIGFAPSIDRALVIPFTDPDKPDGNYWPTFEEEFTAWTQVRDILALPKEWSGQNFIYDMGFLWRTVGIPVPHMTDDTMLLHHALYIEMEKSLGFMGTVHTDEASWKMMRKTHTIKRED